MPYDRSKNYGHFASKQFESLEARSLLATFNVTSLADVGAGSLREAIDAANASPGADTIHLQKKGTIKLASTLSITDHVSIQTAANTRVVLDGLKKSALMTIIADGVNVTLTGLWMRGGVSGSGGAALVIAAGAGSVNLDRITTTGMASTGANVEGGAIRIISGVVLITSSIISKCVASATTTALGGAIANHGQLTIRDSSILGNRATAGQTASGGGIFSDGSLVLEGCVVDGNKAEGLAGVKGVAGARGANGARGEPGEDGESGDDGDDGTNGIDGGTALGGGVFSAGALSITRGSVSANTVRGGKGGDGGPGGAGGNGGGGGRGFREEGKSIPGGIAGAGGSGGAGGNAGKGGQAAGGGIYSSGISAAVIAGDAESPVVIERNVVTAAAAGKAGKGGAGGSGSERGQAGNPGQAGEADPEVAHALGGGIAATSPLTVLFARIAKNIVTGFSGAGGGIAALAASSVSDSLITFNAVNAIGKGADGARGATGAKGARGEPGEDGEEGDDADNGSAGGNGGSAHGGGVFFGDGQHSLLRCTMTNNTLKAAAGGKGGDGGNGGAGGAGGRGFSEDGESFPGGSTGAGGDGGQGGNGGDGGSALGAGVFGLTPDQSNTLSGNQAVAGLAGLAGKGGKGGSGSPKGDNGIAGVAGATGVATA